MKTVLFLSAAVMCCTRCVAETKNADAALRAIYTEEWKWRLEQFPGLEGVTKPVQRLPKVDPETQRIRTSVFGGSAAQARQDSARAALAR